MKNSTIQAEGERPKGSVVLDVEVWDVVKEEGTWQSVRTSLEGERKREFRVMMTGQTK